MTAARLAATEQVCLEAIQERDRLLVKLERVEGERDRYREGLLRLAETARSLWNLAEAMETMPASPEWENLREPLWDAVQDVATAYEKARFLLAPAVPARQMTLEDTAP